jgi:hypothetical protein
MNGELLLQIFGFILFVSCEPWPGVRDSRFFDAANEHGGLDSTMPQHPSLVDSETGMTNTVRASPRA